MHVRTLRTIVAGHALRSATAIAAARNQKRVARLRRAVQELRVKMERKKTSAAKTYQKGNIALMRRIHQQNQDDEVRTCVL